MTDRRHSYPFTNCTDCGPRFTIVEGVPYDRARTTMHAFTMCPSAAPSMKTHEAGASMPSQTPVPPAGLGSGWRAPGNARM